MLEIDDVNMLFCKLNFKLNCQVVIPSQHFSGTFFKINDGKMSTWQKIGEKRGLSSQL